MKDPAVLYLYHEVNVGDYILVRPTLAHHPDRIWLLVTHKDPMPEPVMIKDFSGRGDVVNGNGHIGWYASQIVYPGTQADALAGVGITG